MQSLFGSRAPRWGLVLLACVAGFLAFVGCDDDDENGSRYDAPADHTISKDGAQHLPGLNDPEANCTSCHGDDLRGGSVGVSCYECHGQEW
jgi:hypothetical protein